MTNRTTVFSLGIEITSLYMRGVLMKITSNEYVFQEQYLIALIFSHNIKLDKFFLNLFFFFLFTFIIVPQNIVIKF